jgi:putative copper resistance protein D
VILPELLPYVRAVHFAATVTAAGIVLFHVFVAGPAFGSADRNPSPAVKRLLARFLRLVWASLAVAVLSGAAWLLLLAADIYDAPVSEVWANGGAWTVATQTRFGRIWSIRLGLAALLALSFTRLLSARQRTGLNYVPAILAAAFLITPAWTGHAGAMPGLSGQFDVIADALHLLAAGVWVGGLLPLAMLLAPAHDGTEPGWTAAVPMAVSRFSLLGMASVAALLASGLINTWYEVGSRADLIETQYGRLVLAKIGLFAAMVGIATVNRFHLTPGLAAAANMRRLRRNCLAETLLGLAALFAVGFLGTMAPAAHAHHHAGGAAIPADAAFIHIHSTQGMADVTIVPGRTGAARAIIRLLNDDLDPLAAKRVTLTLTAPAPASRPIVRSAALATDGAWEVDGIELSQPGNWMVEVGAVLRRGDSLSLAAPIVIEPNP